MPVGGRGNRHREHLDLHVNSAFSRFSGFLSWEGVDFRTLVPPLELGLWTPTIRCGRLTWGYGLPSI